MLLKPETTVVPAQLLRARPSTPLPDLTPFLQRAQVKEHMSDVFEDYDNLLLETTLRLLYQMKKLADGRLQLAVTFDTRLQHLLAEVSYHSVPFRYVLHVLHISLLMCIIMIMGVWSEDFEC
jgi:hypothetical protein